MQQIRFRRWLLTYDREATIQAYAKISQGAPESCGCHTCQNFVADRITIYPPEVTDLFNQLGVRVELEAEVVHICKLEPGLHLYGGWFHFVGEIVAGADARRPLTDQTSTFDLEQLTDNFSLGFTAGAQLIPETFAGYKVAQIEFQAKVPWILETPEPEL